MSKVEKNFVVTAIDVGDTCDGHARILGVFDTHEEAEAYVKEDMKDVFNNMGRDDDSIFDEVKHEVWLDGSKTKGCIWDILDLNKPEEQE